MAYRVEELAAKADVSVDTIRYYQARDILPPPARSGRVALYSDEHLERLARIRRLQGRGFSLAVIRRILDGELDQADEALVVAVSRDKPASDEWLTIEQLAERSGIPLAILQAVEREGLLVARRVDGEPRYTTADADAATAGLRLLQHGLPLSELLELARVHTAAMRSTAELAVELFDRHVRHPLREQGLASDEAAARLVAAFEEVLPATLTIVAHHFRRTLLAVAQEHIERVGSDDERRVVADQAAWAE
jgi:DNA-binding transcriptional MerR regulator